MRTIAIANYKGGCGKTTTAVNMAYNMAAVHNKKVLLIDADPQGNASYMLGKKNETAKTLSDVLNGKCNIHKAIRKTVDKNLYYIPSCYYLEDMEGIGEYTLSEAIQDIQGKYDYIIIDCHPGMQMHTINALVAADELLIPAQPDIFGLNGIDLMMKWLETIREYNRNIKIIGCLITMWKNTRSQNKAVETLMETMQIRVLDTCVYACEAVNSAQIIRKPLMRHRKNARATTDYLELVQEYLELEEMERRESE